MPAQPLITPHGPPLTCAAQRRDGGGGGHQRHAQHGRPPPRGPAPHGGPHDPFGGRKGGHGRGRRTWAIAINQSMLALQSAHAGVAMGAHGRGARRGASHAYAPRPRAGHAACGGARALRRLSPQQFIIISGFILFLYKQLDLMREKEITTEARAAGQDQGRDEDWVYVHVYSAMFFAVTDVLFWQCQGMSWQHLHQPCVAGQVSISYAFPPTQG